MPKRKPVPVFFVGLSVLYFVYVVSNPSSRMTGVAGGEPGGMVLPLFLAVFMFASSVYLFITDKPKGAREKMGRAELGLFIFTLVFSIAYILLIRILGFILCTCLLLFCLCFANSRGALRREDLKTGGPALFLTLLFQTALYSLGRYITRSLLAADRSGALPAWMGNAGFTFFATAAVLAGICLILIFALRKTMSAGKRGPALHEAWVSALVAVISTQLLYLVFRQLFLVQLAQGLIGW